MIVMECWICALISINAYFFPKCYMASWRLNLLLMKFKLDKGFWITTLIENVWYTTRSSCFFIDYMVFFRKFRTIVPPNKTTDLYDIINKLWITGKQPTPSHLQQPKYIVSFIHVIHRKHHHVSFPLKMLSICTFSFSFLDF